MKPKRILVVDDDRSFVELIRLSLRELRCDLEIASDGLLALDRLTKSRYDVVLCDYHLPHIDGVEIIQTAQKNSPKCKIVLVSATSVEALAMELEEPLSGFIQKPCSPVKLREVVSEILSA